MSILAEDAPYSKRQGEFVCIIHAFNSSKGLTLTDLKELFKSACHWPETVSMTSQWQLLQ